MRSYKLTTALFLLCALTACSGSSDSGPQNGPAPESEQDALLPTSRPVAGADPTAASSASTALTSGAPAEPVGGSVMVAAPRQIAGRSRGAVSANVVNAASAEASPLLSAASVASSMAGNARSTTAAPHREDGAWETVQFGRGNVVKNLHTARVNVAAKRNRNSSELSLVEVPTLALQFLAHEENGRLWLSPVQDVPGTVLRAHDSYPAAEVLGTLQPLAARVGPGNQ